MIITNLAWAGIFLLLAGFLWSWLELRKVNKN